MVPVKRGMNQQQIIQKQVIVNGMISIVIENISATLGPLIQR